MTHSLQPGMATERPVITSSVLVELVDDEGRGAGRVPVAVAHQWPPQLHRAFSVVLHDGAGRVLLQQRAAAKQRWPGAWANSCCGHPTGRSQLVNQAVRRVGEELGGSAAIGLALTEVGQFIYRARMDGGQWWEFEFDHVLLGQIDPHLPLTPDPAEVSRIMWHPWDQALDCAHTPSAAPWLAQVLEIAASAAR